MPITGKRTKGDQGNRQWAKMLVTSWLHKSLTYMQVTLFNGLCSLSLYFLQWYNGCIKRVLEKML